MGSSRCGERGGVGCVCTTRSPSVGAGQIGLTSAFVSCVEGIKKLECMHKGYLNPRCRGRRIARGGKKNNTWDSNVVPHRSTNQAR